MATSYDRFVREFEGTYVKRSIIKAIAYGNATNAVGTVPLGAILLPTQFVVSTAFTGGTPAIIVGIATNTDSLMAAADITEGTAATYTSYLEVTGTALTAAMAVVCTTSGSSTAGAGLCILNFLMPAMS
jgi:hypothetical protein